MLPGSRPKHETSVQGRGGAFLSLPEAAAGLAAGVQGDPASQLHERHDARDFETNTQDKLYAPDPL